jgi:hypothetical protein
MRYDAAGLDAVDDDRPVADEGPGSARQIERQRRVKRAVKHEIEPPPAGRGEGEPLEVFEVGGKLAADGMTGSRLAAWSGLARRPHKIEPAADPHISLRRGPHRPGSFGSYRFEPANKIKELSLAATERGTFTQHGGNRQERVASLALSCGAGFARLPEEGMRVYGWVYRHG